MPQIEKAQAPLDIASGKTYKKIKGIETYTFSQRLRYKDTIDINNADTYTDDMYDEDPGILSNTNKEIVQFGQTQRIDENTTYLSPTIEQIMNQSNPHKVIRGTTITSVEGEEDDQQDDIYDGEANNSVSDLRALDIASKPLSNNQGDPIRFIDKRNGYTGEQKESIKQVLSSNTIEEWLHENASIPLPKAAQTILGTDKLDLLDGTIGGVTAQALNTYNEAANVLNAFGLNLPKAGYPEEYEGTLNQAIVPLQEYKNQYLKTIRMGYQNSKLYNRLINAANSAADINRMLDVTTYTTKMFDNLSNDKNIFDFSGATYPKEFDTTMGELLELNTASFATMNTLGNKPQISIKTKNVSETALYRNKDGSRGPTVEVDDLLNRKNGGNLGVGYQAVF